MLEWLISFALMQQYQVLFTCDWAEGAQWHSCDWSRKPQHAHINASEERLAVLANIASRQETRPICSSGVCT